MKWFDRADRSHPIISPQAEIDGFLRKRGAIPDFGVHKHFLMLQTGCDIPVLCQQAQVTEEEFPLPTFLGKRQIYTVNGAPRISVIEKALGAPAAVDALEIAIVMGARKLFFFGLCGAVGKDVEVGDLIVPVENIREEGTSYHYLSAEEVASPDIRLARKLTGFLMEQKELRIHTGTTVSTDAVYRQTLRKERTWRTQGILCVDMEMSSLLAVAKFHKLPAVGLLVVSDKHVLEEDYKWQWGGQHLADSRTRAITLFIKFIRNEEKFESTTERNT
jgi:uridine phosphorylase